MSYNMYLRTVCTVQLKDNIALTLYSTLDPRELATVDTILSL